MGCSLLLVGCGKMGGAMLDGWFAAGTVDDVVVVEPQGAFGADAGSGGRKIVRCAGASRIPAGFDPDVVVLAVKPQVMDEVVPGYARFTRPDTVFLSIAAGKTIGYFTERLGADAAIVRAMPNTPAAVGRGMTVAVANAAVTEGQRQLCDTLLAAVGQVAWVEDEALLDAVTAVSGGGPAYVFLLIEALAKAGVAAGLPEDLATRIARVTVAGSGELAIRSSEPAATLRRNVTSPNGTTQAALEVLMAEDGVQPLFDRAIAAATARSRELAG
ncbi:pyrroline-5-carboxylate reductase [Skermanella stibiiresistens SB22]|uniref:Pyrroline-5-carboxylate reductase n=1 Tax=Skermanella stibiiresistens SB22 TaxID=1385369 RepID=W9H4I8_9PROT|nr:pyrroline-5-carboxylate reductase [Skermanella stibiiresistens]EWY41135.1 pyrroline-5-carboxylate reductase [Skermanella stibiiresistens SB22]